MVKLKMKFNGMSKVMFVGKDGKGLEWDIDGEKLEVWKHLGILGFGLMNKEGTSGSDRQKKRSKATLGVNHIQETAANITVPW